MSIYKQIKHHSCSCFPQLNVIALICWKVEQRAVERRNYMTANQIAFNKAKEEARHNRVSERHEHYDTRSRRMQAEAASSQAATAARQVDVNWWAAQEGQRANMAKEAETYRHNYQQEELSRYQAMTAAAAAQDQARAALQQARIAGVNAATRQSELAETIRRNSAAITQAQLELRETGRRNLAQEAISRSSVAEQSRANQAAEALRGLELEEKTRHAMEEEKIGVSQALSASKRASASETSASASVVSAGAAAKQADVAESRASSDKWRNRFLNTKDAVGIAKDVASTIGGFFK